MSAAERLVQVVGSLQDVGLRPLVMGGHAVRHYGVDRNTVDFDLHISTDAAVDLETALRRTEWFPGGDLREGPGWRRRDFRRFQIGTLPDGREEWLEFWIRNHLLAPFEILWHRREWADFGSRRIPYLSLDDLIRSKETERESDWQDVAMLEEIRDMRRLVDATDVVEKLAALGGVRSRRGFERALAEGIADDEVSVRRALQFPDTLISLAFLLPPAPHAVVSPPADVTAWRLLETPPRQVAPGSARHLALVEAARRLHKKAAMEADRADKESYAE